ncbi:hypothetical protein [Actinomycetospora chiangmaiensis]|uniref:hypothetical protein n=1 Tax=Actinomycetospora chiangmaiensis TaxID=402650 RepID=UPI00038059F9|nr:hypothetical protein [Actinomycetospora chiangmaiensis]
MSTSNGTAPTGNVTDQVADAVARGQQMMTELTSGVTELWTAALSGADDATRRVGTGSLPGGLPSAGEFVDRAYDTGIALLEMQRSAAHQVLGAMSAFRTR